MFETKNEKIKKVRKKAPLHFYYQQSLTEVHYAANK